MKGHSRILVAFVLNLLFSVFEFVGGLWIGSVAILSDALHDLGDAMSIGLAFFLEKKSLRPPDARYTYGYGRFSALGGMITSLILLAGSCLVVIHSVQRLFVPNEIRYNAMIVFAAVGAVVNFTAALVTRHGESVNQRAVNLHMLEDVLGYVAVLIGAVVMRFTGFWQLDSILSIAVAVFIFIHAAKNLREGIRLFLEKTPEGISVPQLCHRLEEIPGVIQVHHLHVWSRDGDHHNATLHTVIRGDAHQVKDEIRHVLSHFHIDHVTVETEAEGEACHAQQCSITPASHGGHHHHHHHHHH